MRESMGESREVDIAALRKKLISQGVDLSLWGIPPAKTVENLFVEIDNKEASLSEEDGELLRCVQVANLSIFHRKTDGTLFWLEEIAEEFPDGTKKKRDRIARTSLSETIRQDENFESAARRGLAEELGITNSYPIEHIGLDVQIKTSQSYPGLKTKYNFLLGKAFLSKEDYAPDGYKEVDKVSGVITHFSWVHAEEDVKEKY